LRELPVRSQYGGIGPIQFSRQGARSGNIGAGEQPELRLPVSGDRRQRYGPANRTSSSRRSGRFVCPEGTSATSRAVGIGILPLGDLTELISASDVEFNPGVIGRPANHGTTDGWYGLIANCECKLLQLLTTKIGTSRLPDDGAFRIAPSVDKLHLTPEDAHHRPGYTSAVLDLTAIGDR